MPLSEEELRLLEQMEQALAQEDPKFASTLRGSTLERAARMRTIAAGVVFVARRRDAHGRRRHPADLARHPRLRGHARLGHRRPGRLARSARAGRSPQRSEDQLFDFDDQPHRFDVIEGGSPAVRKLRRRRRKAARARAVRASPSRAPSCSAWSSAGSAAATRASEPSDTRCEAPSGPPDGARPSRAGPPATRVAVIPATRQVLSPCGAPVVTMRRVSRRGRRTSEAGQTLPRQPRPRSTLARSTRRQAVTASTVRARSSGSSGERLVAAVAAALHPVAQALQRGRRPRARPRPGPGRCAPARAASGSSGQSRPRSSGGRPQLGPGALGEVGRGRRRPAGARRCARRSEAGAIHQRQQASTEHDGPPRDRPSRLLRRRSVSAAARVGSRTAGCLAGAPGLGAAEGWSGSLRPAGPRRGARRRAGRGSARSAPSRRR